MADIRYIGRFASRDGYVYQARLNDNTFDGEATEFPLSSVTFEAGRRGTHIFTPIRASSIKLQGWKLSLADLDELFGAEVGRFTCEAWRGSDQETVDSGGGALYWKGIVQTDLGEDDTASVISSAQITATDGLSLLRDVPYPDPYGRERHIDTIWRCLEQIGYALPLSIAAHWYPDDGEDGDILWELAETDDSIFFDENGNYLYCYDVLKQMLYPYGGLLFWREGKFHIVQKSQIGAGEYVTHEYDADFVPGVTTEYEVGSGGTTNDSSLGKRLSGSRVYRPAVGGVSIVYNHGNLPDLIESPDFTDGEDWTFGGSGGSIILSQVLTSQQIARVAASAGRYASTALSALERAYNQIRAELIPVGFVTAFFYGTDASFGAARTAIKASDRFLYQEGGSVTAGDFIAFVARLRIPYNAGAGNGLFNSFFTIQIGDNADAYLSRDGTWITPSGSEDLQAIVEPGTTWNQTGMALSRNPGEGWYDVVIVSEAAPYSGAVKLTLWGTADRNGSDLDPVGVEWALASVIIADPDGDLRDTLIFEASTSSPEPVDEELVLLIGEGPRPDIPAAITWNGEYAENWTDGEAGPENLLKLLARNRLGFQSGRLDARLETYQLETPYEMGDPIDINGDLYDVVWLQKDLASQIDTIEPVRITFDDSDVSFASRAEDRGLYSAAAGQNASTASAQPAVAQVIEEKGDLIVGDADGLPARLASGEEDGYMIITSGEEDKGWSVVDPIEIVAPIAAALIDEIESPITTKGDFLVGNGEGEPVRLSKPVDGKVWVADSTQPLGWRAEDFESGGGEGDPSPGSYAPVIYATLDEIRLDASLPFEFYPIPDTAGGDVVFVTAAELAAGEV